MHVPLVKPIGPVQQNNAMPWLPPIKTLSREKEEIEWAPANRPGQRAEEYDDQWGTTVCLQMAYLAAAQQHHNQQAAAPYPVVATALAQPPAAAEGPTSAYLLELLQREREQLKNQALHNELLMRTVLASAAPAPAGPSLMSGDHGLWHPMGGAVMQQMQSTVAAWHPMASPAITPMQFGVQFGSVSTLQERSSRSSVDYTSDDSSTSGTKRKERESSSESDSSLHKKRMYVKAACNACRVSHIACDDSQPCRNCVRSGSHCQRMVPVKVYVPPSFEGKRPPVEDAGDAGDGSGQNSRSIELALMGRKYVKAACICCRRSHLACDNYRPCRNCVRMGVNCEEVRSQRRSVDCTKRRRGPQHNALKQLMAAA
jgi:hypothetical protein